MTPRPDHAAARPQALPRAGLEVKTERDKVWSLLQPSEEVEVVRVFYRRPPTRRWTKFLLIPDERQSLESLERLAAEAARQHERNGVVTYG